MSFLPEAVNALLAVSIVGFVAYWYLRYPSE